MRRLAGLALCGVLLAGCSGGGLTPQGRLQDDTAELVDQANAKDLAGLRAAAADLRQEIDDQVRAGQLTQARAQLLLRLLAAIERDAFLVNGEPTPSATPSPTASPTPSPTPSPTLSPTPSPTPSPTASPTPLLPTLFPSHTKTPKGQGSPTGSPTP
ncbi:MAG: hypothetical protein M3P04_05605 [Actinomycetota bacterium]|nr:hypothetical protein [Actinomycetota bacterium]